MGIVAGARAWAELWVVTSLLHGTILLLGAWGLSWRLRGRHPELEDAAWKAAVFGGLLTAAVQVSLPATSLAGAFSWPMASNPAAPDPSAVPVALAAPAAHGTGADAASGRSLPLPAALFSAWAVGALLGAGALASTAAMLRSRLRDRRDVTHAATVHRFRRLQSLASLGRPVRLTESTGVDTPVAWGLRRFEICLPGRALRDLPDEQMDAVLAHELAHLARRDPGWLAGFLAMEALFFFQPLYRVARRRWVDASELACDDWAVARTREPLALARSLAGVAGWLAEGRPVGPVPAMAAPGSPLGRRVRRLLARPEGGGPRRTRALAVVAAAMAMVTMATPSIGQKAGATIAPPPPSRPAPPAYPELPLPPVPAEAPSFDDVDDLDVELPELPEVPELPELPDLPEPPEMAAAELALLADDAVLAGSAVAPEDVERQLQLALESMPTSEQMEEMRSEVRRALEEASRAVREQSQGLSRMRQNAARELERAARELAAARERTARELAEGHRQQRERHRQDMAEMREQLRREREELALERRRLDEERRELERERERMEEELARAGDAAVDESGTGEAPEDSPVE